MVKQDAPGFKIYIKEGIPLNSRHAEAYKVHGMEPGKKASLEQVQTARGWMCQQFFDVRTFGAVMMTGDNCGQVRGPVQLNFSRSLDPVTQQEVTITRLTVTRIEDAEKERTMGRKFIVPYGLYRVEGYISAKLANDPTKGTGFSEEDLELFWEALWNMFEHDHSAARGKMSARHLFIFKHESELGNAPAHKLFDLVRTVKLDSKPPRNYADYELQFDRSLIPDGVTLIERR
jgi:CRISPR-associated protein Csd2